MRAHVLPQCGEGRAAAAAPEGAAWEGRRRHGSGGGGDGGSANNSSTHCVHALAAGFHPPALCEVGGAGTWVSRWVAQAPGSKVHGLSRLWDHPLLAVGGPSAAECGEGSGRNGEGQSQAWKGSSSDRTAIHPPAPARAECLAPLPAPQISSPSAPCARSTRMSPRRARSRALLGAMVCGAGGALPRRWRRFRRQAEALDGRESS